MKLCTLDQSFKTFVNTRAFSQLFVASTIGLEMLEGPWFWQDLQFECFSKSKAFFDLLVVISQESFLDVIDVVDDKLIISPEGFGPRRSQSTQLIDWVFQSAKRLLFLLGPLGYWFNTLARSKIESDAAHCPNPSTRTSLESPPLLPLLFAKKAPHSSGQRRPRKLSIAFLRSWSSPQYSNFEPARKNKNERFQSWTVVGECLCRRRNRRLHCGRRGGFWWRRQTRGLLRKHKLFSCFFLSSFFLTIIFHVFRQWAIYRWRRCKI